MQDGYAGDIGDFGKYGLLRSLCSPGGPDDRRDLTLGVAWYLFHPHHRRDQAGSADGGHVSYLCQCLPEISRRNRKRFRDCDPDLYDALGEIVRHGRRSVGSIQEAGVLPDGTVYHDAPLGFHDLRGPGLRDSLRKEWVGGMQRRMDGRDVVFVDPDNGLRVKGEDGYHLHRLGPKYAHYDELKPMVLRDQSLVVYHHADRTGPVPRQVERRLDEIGEHLGRGAEALIYRRGTVRFYFVIAAERHRELLSRRVRRFLETRWNQHFELHRRGA